MREFIYLDNSATTKPCQTAINETVKAMEQNWGNPSSLYSHGINAEILISTVREKIASIINCREDEIFFTSGGTEANNLCIRGVAEKMKRRGNKIVTTSVEHPSVLNTCDSLSESGFQIVKIKPEADGHIDVEKVKQAIDQNTILVTMMLVNNETGCIFPVKEIAEYIKENKLITVLHSDCVQAFGKYSIGITDLGADLITASGHKIHGPKGVGFLYKSKKININPIVFGGNQEKGLRSGTEAVPLIAGLGGALDELTVKKSLIDIEALRNYAKDKLLKIPGCVINSPENRVLPYIINISLPGYRSETLLHFLESKSIFVSSGSACAKGKGSHVLNEMGLGANIIDSALRISFSKNSTEADIDALCEALLEATQKLRKK